MYTLGYHLKLIMYWSCFSHYHKMSCLPRESSCYSMNSISTLKNVQIMFSVILNSYLSTQEYYLRKVHSDIQVWGCDVLVIIFIEEYLSLGLPPLLMAPGTKGVVSCADVMEEEDKEPPRTISWELMYSVWDYFAVQLIHLLHTSGIGMSIYDNVNIINALFWVFV